MDFDHEAIPAPTLTHVLVHEPYEVRRWCQRLVCTEAQLRLVVARVGADAESVRAEIDKLR